MNSILAPENVRKFPLHLASILSGLDCSNFLSVHFETENFHLESATFRFTCLSPNQNFKKDARQRFMSSFVAKLNSLTNKHKQKINTKL